MKAFVQKHSFVWPILGSLLIWVFIGLVSGQFGVGTFFSAAKLATFSLLLGLAQMIVVTSGDGAIDLSQIYILTLSAYVSCNLMNTNIFLGLLAAVAVGMLCGLANGCIDVFLHIPAMITTLASGYIIFTVILILAPHMKTLPNSDFVSFINKNLGGFSMLTVIAIVVAALLAVLLYRTQYGKQLHAVGQNRIASGYSGIAVGRVVIIAFVLAGGISGLAGALCGAFIGGAFQDMGSTYFLPSIAAAFVGGTAAAGGKSSVLGVCFGALMMSFMTTFLNAANLSPGMQKLILGAFLVLILVASVSNGARKK
ncbi:Ribose ABC transport system, permease protein RbsC (TC 3.A.1.2.1) [Ruminococcaceae bacterium BL-6]|nr:Ribose ABC transport system, permease protein RbsC (TC 3.A.1.2.1) [Ruminococcaceae bacterium BL-6]